MNIEQTIAALTAAQDALEAPCAAFKAAQRAYDRSRSKKNRAALIAAQAEFDAALEIVDQAFAECDRAEEAAELDAAAARAAARAAEQPSLF
ncbi:MAG: hypothetical protein LC676_10860 [Loktanella sp.]|nr:hypothetical protein [Loktanella sp.]